MLWTDGLFVTTADLRRLDSQVAEVAEAEQISLTDPYYGSVRGAIEEAGRDLQNQLVMFGGYIGNGSVSANHLSAVMNVKQGSNSRSKAVLSQVVVSGETEYSWNIVKEWAVFSTLSFFYRDCFGRTVKDRYESKMRYYRSELSRRILPRMRGSGIPLVTSPLPRPGALFERDAGTWDNSNLSQTAGSGTIQGTRDVVVTYVDMTAVTPYVDEDNRGNSESHPSDRASISLTSGNVLRVSISTLVPPTGVQHPAQQIMAVVKPLTATHWNVYVGTLDGPLYLQNASPIPIDTTTYTLTGDPVTSGANPGVGQYPDRLMTLLLTRQRA